MYNLKALEKEQLELAKKVEINNKIKNINTIAGCDQAFFENKILSLIVVLDYKTLEVIEKKHAIRECKMPYIPGFQGYREGPAIAEAYSLLDTKPDIFMLDANGILHQRRFGAASHIGILLDIPTIGVAKSLSLGKVRDGKVEIDGEIRGIEIKSKDISKPIYISPGHKISIAKSLEVVNHCLKGNKLPAPLHLAHKFSTKIRNKLKTTSS